MTKKQLMHLLTEEAIVYRKKALSSIKHNRHMNDLSRRDFSRLKKHPRHTQRMADALLVDFINTVGTGQSLNQGLYTKHLKPKPDSRA